MDSLTISPYQSLLLASPLGGIQHGNIDNEYKFLILFTQPLRSGRIWHKVNFKAEFKGFEFRVFLLLD